MRVIDQLVIVNLRHEAREKMPTVLNGLEWQTCLRRILFLNGHENAAVLEAFTGDKALSSIEVYRGQAAYRFLLEVICGLNSPIVGETAVMGQFKEFLLTAKFPQNSWGNFLRQLATNLMIDAKRVRHEHLQGIGSQSYGSLVRQHVKGLPAVAVLGAGKLAREILPWLIGKTRVRIFYRNWENARDLRQEYPEVELVRYEDADAGWQAGEIGLVIAAPLKSHQVERWVELQSSRFPKCLDLRGDATSDPLVIRGQVVRLNELFDALRGERERLAAHVTAARVEIREMVERQARQAQFRPFGWEDLCA